jgi:type I restriction enzyme S subunit
VTATFKPYPKYKPSGVEWLGDIPEHWKTERGKWVFSERKEAKFEDDEQLASTQKYGVIPQKLFMELESQKVVQATAGIDNFTHVEDGDFVISLRSFQGGIEASAYKGCVSPAYTVLAPRQKIQVGYWKHLLKSFSFLQALQTTIEGIRDGKTIKYDQFGRIHLPCPSAEIQKSIANFLDSETAKIDETIKELEASIELLNEEKTSLINEYVTGKINPETGKPYPKYKPSGVEWLGDIPEHWNCAPLRRLMSAHSGTDGKSEIGTTPLYGANGVIGMSDSPSHPEGCLLIGRVGSAGAITLVEEACAVSDNALVAHPKVILDKLFLFYLLRSLNLESDLSKNAQPLLTATNLGKKTITYSSDTNEQSKTASLIHLEICKHDSLISEKESLIETLKEYRTSLIHEAVTGKIDLRNA